VDQALLSSVRHDWRTPEVVLWRVHRLGPIGLDPCTDVDNPCNAATFMTRDGLERSWAGHGLVYCNPPYGRAIKHWIAKCATEAAAGVEIIALVPSRTDTAWWHEAYTTCQSVAFWMGRLTFRDAPASAPFPSCLFYWGKRSYEFGQQFAERARAVYGGGIT
jgi:phage N-6-adenine-methyltransferase